MDAGLYVYPKILIQFFSYVIFIDEKNLDGSNLPVFTFTAKHISRTAEAAETARSPLCANSGKGR